MTLVQAFKEAMFQLDQHRKASTEGLDNMSLARRLMKRAEAIRKDIDSFDSMEGTWITFKVGGMGIEAA